MPSRANGTPTAKQQTEKRLFRLSVCSSFLGGEQHILYIYPDDLRAKPKQWLWELRDVAVIGIGALLSVLALVQGRGMFLLILTVLYAFLSIRMEDASILAFLRNAVRFLIPDQQDYEWRIS